MVRTRSESSLVRRLTEDGSGRRPDDLVVEEPLSILLDDVQVSSTMRTPGHDFELAAGFCLTEGVLADAPIVGIRYCGTGRPADSDFNVVSVDTAGKAPAPTPRLGSTSSSCGLCGSEAIGELTERLRVLRKYEPWDTGLLLSLPDAAAPHQELYANTGATHSAAAFTRDGEMLVIREDIGRHNAVDKVIGRLLMDSCLPASDLALFVSGRASFEMVQKAWAAGFTALVAVSGPSSLAIATAKRAGMTVIGFARGSTGTLYSPTEAL